MESPWIILLFWDIKMGMIVWDWSLASHFVIDVNAVSMVAWVFLGISYYDWCGTVSPALCPNSKFALVWIDVAPASHFMIDVLEMLMFSVIQYFLISFHDVKDGGNLPRLSCHFKNFCFCIYLLSEMTIANFILFYILLLGSINQQIKIESLIGRKMRRGV